jgi:hypothetical protein
LIKHVYPKEEKRRICKQHFKKYFVPIGNLWYKDQSLPVFKKFNFIEGIQKYFSAEAADHLTTTFIPCCKENC